MSHITHTKEPVEKHFRCLCTHTNHVTHTNESHIQMSDVYNECVSCHPYESCHTYERVTHTNA